jgi:hypothetical protein
VGHPRIRRDCEGRDKHSYRQVNESGNQLILEDRIQGADSESQHTELGMDVNPVGGQTMSFHRKWPWQKTLKNDQGFEVTFLEPYDRGEKLRYSEGKKQKTFLAEPALIETPRGEKMGLHLALQAEYLARWDDGSNTTLEERELIRMRMHDALSFLKIPHSIGKDLPGRPC